MDRRNFLKNTAKLTAGVIGFPYIVSSTALGKSGTVSPNGRINIGCIGMGGMGNYNLGAFLNIDQCRVVALCDIDKTHLNISLGNVNDFYGNKDCKGYHDFNDILARNDIDAVMIATPDHWHSIPAIAAAKAGKDIYGEKPLSHTFNEGLEICKAVERYGVVWQTGSWQRSQSSFRFASELVLNGCIGKVHTVEIGLPEGPHVFNIENEKITAPPDYLDYDRWLGPAPKAPYCKARVHGNWRWNLDYGGGQMMDWIGHHADIAHWGLGFDNTGPLEVEGVGEYIKGHVWNSAAKYKVYAKYPKNVSMVIAGGYENIKMGVKWIGDSGWVHVSRQGIDADPKDLLRKKFGYNDINLLRSEVHQQNFLDCVKSRSKTLTPCDVAHRSATPGHLGQIAMLLGRKIKFDPVKQIILNDTVAQRMLGKTFRSPWYI